MIFSLLFFDILKNLTDNRSIFSNKKAGLPTGFEQLPSFT